MLPSSAEFGSVFNPEILRSGGAFDIGSSREMGRQAASSCTISGSRSAGEEPVAHPFNLLSWCRGRLR